MSDWLENKGECHVWIDNFEEQPDKWGYLNNPSWTDPAGDPVSYTGNEEEEPVVWPMTNRRF